MVDARRLDHLHIAVIDLADEQRRLPERAEQLAVSRREALTQARADSPKSQEAHGRRLRK